MLKKNEIARLLTKLKDICLALPEASLAGFGHHLAFVVRKKKFAYFLESHHGDGIIAICFKIEPEERELLMKSDPARFYKPAYIGTQGWVGCRLDLGENDWQQVRELAIDSYCIQAPKKLAASLDLCP